VNSINWLAGDDHMIAIQPRVTQDAQILLSDNIKMMLVVGFLFGLPLGSSWPAAWCGGAEENREAPVVGESRLGGAGRGTRLVGFFQA